MSQKLKSVSFEQLLREFNSTKGWNSTKEMLTKQYVPLEQIRYKHGYER
ncbi:MAG: hypothetical protein WC325_12415 [Candidatus Bathyarchaeia archaeon]|jgi:hypothetical protein